MIRVLVSMLLVALSTPLPTASAQQAPPWFDRVLEGTIGDRPATIDLRREEDRMNGLLDGDRHDRDRWVTGAIEPDGTFRLEEHDAEEGSVALLVGRFVRDTTPSIAIRGTYVVDGDSLPFSFRERGVGVGAAGRLVSRVVTRGDSATGYVARAEVPTARPADTASAAEAAALFALGRVADSIVRVGMEAFAADLDLENPYEFGPPFPSTWEVAWYARLANEAVVSLEFRVYVYYTGAAHPNTHTVTLTWDLAERRRIELADLFRAGSPWVEVVSRRAIEQIVAKLGEWAEGDGWVREGAGPDPANFTGWTIDPAGLRIVFDPYQVAAYAAGPQIVTIPWDALADVLDPAGPWTAAGTP